MAQHEIVTDVTPECFYEWRIQLHLTQAQLAALLQVSGHRTIRRWEAGEREIPGPVKVLMRWLVTGQRPAVS